jgi:hypothetical protein
MVFTKRLQVESPASAQTAVNSPCMGASYCIALRWITVFASMPSWRRPRCTSVHAESMATADALPPKTVD